MAPTYIEDVFLESLQPPPYSVMDGNQEHPQGQPPVPTKTPFWAPARSNNILNLSVFYIVLEFSFPYDRHQISPL